MGSTESSPWNRLIHSIVWPWLAPLCLSVVWLKMKPNVSFLIIWNAFVVMDKMGLSDEEILIRMTGCPNGCARPYMAELAFVGDGAKTYQIWLGGSPVLTR